MKCLSRRCYSGCQNNAPFQPQNNLVYAGKNSQIKARKSEHGYSLKNIVQQYDFNLPIEATLTMFSLTRSNLLRQLPSLN
jgi:hypothetical protein